MGIIYLGTDLQKPHNELAAKNVAILFKSTKDAKILSIQNEKRLSNEVINIPRIFPSNTLRKQIQALLLPIYLTFLRPNNKIIHTFWVADSRYHDYLFRYLRFLRYDLVSTIIGSKEKTYLPFKNSTKIITPSEQSKLEIKKKISKNAHLIYPLNEIISNKKTKKNIAIFAAMPYRKEFLADRGVFKMLNEYKTIQNKLKLVVLFRGGETYKIINKYCKTNGIKAKLINRNLSKRKMISLFSKAKIVVGLYGLNNVPSMPQSLIEGIGCGCAVITTGNSDIADLVVKEKAGIVIKDEKEFSKSINQILKKKVYNSNAFKLREKYFNLEKNLEAHLNLY